MDDIVIFHLNRVWNGKDLWEEIKHGRKTSEWRDVCKYWLKRLITRAELQINGTEPEYLAKFLKVHRAWFVVGYPKGNLPRLEVDITELIHHPSSSELEIKFANVKEVTA